MVTGRNNENVDILPVKDAAEVGHGLDPGTQASGRGVGAFLVHITHHRHLHVVQPMKALGQGPSPSHPHHRHHQLVIGSALLGPDTCVCSKSGRGCRGPSDESPAGSGYSISLVVMVGGFLAFSVVGAPS